MTPIESLADMLAGVVTVDDLNKLIATRPEAIKLILEYLLKKENA